MIMSKQTQTKLEASIAKLEKENLRKEKENQRLKAKHAKENLRKEKEISRKEKENQRLKAKHAKENLRKEKEISRKEKENQRLKAKHAKENSRLEKENLGLKTILAKEDSLWNTELGQKRHSSAQPTRLLHTHEMLEYIISNKKMIKALTRNTKEIFDNTLVDLSQIIKKSNDSPHFRDDQDRKEESGNQCKLYIRHFLFMTQLRKAQDWGQESLGVVFGIDQSTVSNYLKLANKYDDELYTVTPYNMTKYISTIKSKEEFKEIVPGRDGGEITIDGTLVETTRPEDKEEQKKQYSGKGKMFAINTAMMINKQNYILAISDSREGSCHDLTVLNQGLPEFGKWTDRMMTGKRIPSDSRIRLNLDRGYTGIQNYLRGVTAKIPHKKPKGKKLTATKKAQNKAHNKRRVPVENVFAHVKNWKRISGRYDGTAEEFNIEFNGICGMYNKRKMWQDGTYQYWKNKIKSRI